VGTYALVMIDQQAANNRLMTNATPLTQEEMRNYVRVLPILPPQAKERLQAELLLVQLESFKKFDTATGRANLLMLIFTGVVTVLTFLIALMEYYRR
jgi:hypothetical protein